MWGARRKKGLLKNKNSWRARGTDVEPEGPFHRRGKELKQRKIVRGERREPAPKKTPPPERVKKTESPPEETSNQHRRGWGYREKSKKKKIERRRRPLKP